MQKLAAIELLLSDTRGQYIPRDFLTAYDLTQWGYTEQQAIEISNDLSNPENEFYWETWETTLDNAKHTTPEGNVYRLHQDGDLFAICDELMTDDDYLNFYGEERN